jgi:transposase
MAVDTRTEPISNIASYYGIKASTLIKHYKYRSSGFLDWTQKKHAEDYILNLANIGIYLSIDELALSKGELYTFITNKYGKGKQGTIVAIIKGTLTKDIVRVLNLIPIEQRKLVKEVTLDMANNMESAARQAFPEAKLVTDRFHVVKLITEVLQNLRIKHRWEELDIENLAIETSRKEGKKYKPSILANGDTPKQLLARSRYAIAVKPNEWTKSQAERADILFERYPILRSVYSHVLVFRNIYELQNRGDAKNALLNWVDKTNKLNIKEFNSACNTIKNNMENILNFFINRNTNANAESFNAKIKLFRANLRGVVDNTFFLFRLNKLFA